MSAVVRFRVLHKLLHTKGQLTPVEQGEYYTMYVIGKTTLGSGEKLMDRGGESHMVFR